MKLEDVKWVGVVPEGLRSTEVPGVMVPRKTFPNGRLVPPRLEELGRWVLEELLGEYDNSLPGPIKMEAICFSGHVRWCNGEEWWEFSTLSSYSITMWIGRFDGSLITVQSMNDLDDMVEARRSERVRALTVVWDLLKDSSVNAEKDAAAVIRDVIDHRRY